MQRQHLMPFGAEVTPEGVRFAIWAPSAEKVALVLGEDRLGMKAKGQGWFERVAGAKVGDRYAFAVDGSDDMVPDPASRFQSDDLDRRSSVLEPKTYDWQDGGWTGRSWNEVVLCEVHLGTVTPEGTYAALADKLEHFKRTGITAVELMPLAETAGRRTWGYDGVLPFSPNNAYGTPDDLKHLVDKAHGLGLMVFLDVVYNHFGPTGNFLHSYAESFFTNRHETPWGAAINFDGNSDDSDAVREFFIHNALYWLEEFHIDGLRFDAVHAIMDTGDKHFLEEMAERIRDALPGRHIHLVLENENNEARRLARTGDGDALSYDAQWNDDIHHCWHVLLTGESEGYYGDFAGDTIARLGRCLAEGFAYQGEMSPNLGHKRGEPTAGLPPQAFVSFIQNHDQVGNRAQGERLTVLSEPSRLRLARAVLLLAPQIPMIFMGDEWGAETPFQFFVNFEREPDLEQAIREGRTREFERFTSFSGTVPDPTDPETFLRSKLDWSEPERDPFAAILEETRELLALRHAEVIPLMASGFIDTSYARIDEGGLEVAWRFEDGTMRLHANFAASAWSPDIPAASRVLWRTSGGTKLEPRALQSWDGIITLERASA